MTDMRARSTLDTLDPRIPKWANTENRACPFCGADPRGVVITRPDGLDVHACDCGAMFVSPAPTPEALDAFYAAYSEHARWIDAGVDRVRAMKASDPLSDYRTRRLAGLIHFGGARVLDVGFGQGADLVRYSQLGAETHGVDLDHESVRFASTHLGVRAHLGDVESFAPGHDFDLVSLHDVIEHPLDPVALFKGCAPHVRPGGFLSIWTPNGGYARRDPEQVALRVDLEHMQYLAPSTMLQLAARIGWGVVHLEAVGLPALDSFTIGSGSPLRSGVKRMVPGPVLRWRAAHRENLETWCSGRYHLFTVLQRPIV